MWKILAAVDPRETHLISEVVGVVVFVVSFCPQERVFGVRGVLTRAIGSEQAVCRSD